MDYAAVNSGLATGQRDRMAPWRSFNATGLVINRPDPASVPSRPRPIVTMSSREIEPDDPIPVHRDPAKMISQFAHQVRHGETAESHGALRLGVDLGTANIVLSVVDATDSPVAGAWLHSTVVRDGIVVDWAGAVQAVKQLRDDLQTRLGHPLKTASVAIPPGISPGTIKVFTNVLDAAGLVPDEVVDEPVAAARVLGVVDGCVIDVGHGTTGVSILADGKVIKSIDEPTGGHHMTLVLAGAYQISYDKAESLKRNSQRAAEVFGVIRPTVEKMATIAARAIDGFDLKQVYLVGGASSFPSAPAVFEDILGLPVVRPVEPLFVTPLGIPMSHPATPDHNKPTSSRKRVES